MKLEDRDEKIKTLCEDTKRKLTAAKPQLVEAAAAFQGVVGHRVPSKSADAAKLVELLSGADWSRVYPAGLSELAPWDGKDGRIVLDPSHWPEVDSGRLGSALETCHRAFVDLDRAYRAAVRTLPEEELQELFPDGPPKP